MSQESTAVRVRFAPSPTGALHIGGARTAYFNWLFAKKHGGVFVLRIDDTDTSRSTQASYQQILESFRWLGIDWDEGPEVGGPYGPYRQSERQSIYEQSLRQLLTTDKVYPCFCTPEQLQADREQAQKDGKAPRYAGRCAHLDDAQVKAKIAAGERYVYRFRAPVEGETVVHDLIRGDVVFQNSVLDDFIVWKADGTPTYHFASCVDDVAMAITHVIRAEEHLSNTPRHVVLFEALGRATPLFAHIPMILAPDRSKLSKRHGATSVEEYRQDGILPEALINYLLLLGFSPGEDDEIMSPEAAISRFNLDRVTKSAAIYDVKKLQWFNAHYVRVKPVDEVLNTFWPQFVTRGWVAPDETNRAELAWIRTVTAAVQTRARNFADLLDGLTPYFEPVALYDAKGVKKQFRAPEVAERLRQAAAALAQTAPFTAANTERAYRALIEKLAIKSGELIHPTRLALTGFTVGPSLFEVVALFGADECVQRLKRVADLLERGEIAEDGSVLVHSNR